MICEHMDEWHCSMIREPNHFHYRVVIHLFNCSRTIEGHIYGGEPPHEQRPQQVSDAECRRLKLSQPVSWWRCGVYSPSRFGLFESQWHLAGCRRHWLMKWWQPSWIWYDADTNYEHLKNNQQHNVDVRLTRATKHDWSEEVEVQQLCSNLHKLV